MERVTPKIHTFARKAMEKPMEDTEFPANLSGRGLEVKGIFVLMEFLYSMNEKQK